MNVRRAHGTHNRSAHAHNRAAILHLCALALVVLLASSASGQILETTIVLPDTFGPLKGPYHLACTDDPTFPRLYIGGESDSGGVIVADAIKYKRLARIPTGPVKALCYVPTHNKLYVASKDKDTVAVVDCSSYQVVASICTQTLPTALVYDPANDHVYCAANRVGVIDCSRDSLIRWLQADGLDACFALDDVHNKLYVGTSEQLAVVDCAAESIFSTIAGLSSVGALCFNPTAGKVYATSGDTLYAVWVGTDSIVARLPIQGLLPHLACDPQRNRIYSMLDDPRRGPAWASVDCNVDTVMLRVYTRTDSFVACDVLRDKLHYGVLTYQATTGQLLNQISTGGPPGYWSQSLDRLYCVPSRYEPARDIVYERALLTVIDGAGDSTLGVIPLTMSAGQITLDTVHNRLYFVYQTETPGCVGTVDCSRNIVTEYRYAGDWTTAICYNPNNDRLYWATCTVNPGNSVVTVFDCAAGSVVKRIPIGGVILSLKLHESLNKLFVYSDLGYLHIIDCNRDTLLNRVFLAGNYPRPVLLVPEDNRFWYLGVYDVVVVDCVGDTEVARLPDTLGSIDDACACPKDRKIYTNLRQVIDMDNPAHVETTKAWGVRFLYDSRTSRLYVSGNVDYRSVFQVFDVRADTEIGSRFYGPCRISGMCLGPTGDYIYCAGYADSLAFAIDVRRNQVVDTFRVTTYGQDRDPLAVNRSTGRIYEAQYFANFGRGIPVFHDSAVGGVEEVQQSVDMPAWAIPTILRRGVPLATGGSACLYNSTGRVVAGLRPGPNDISHLAPGVYFVREEPQAASLKPQAVRKVIVTR